MSYIALTPPVDYGFEKLTCTATDGNSSADV